MSNKNRAAAVVASLLSLAVLAWPQKPFAPLPAAPACPIFPADNVWNADISSLPVDANSTNIINQIGAATGLHPDFGSFAGYGIPYNVAGNSTPKVVVSFQYANESDPGPYPIPANYLIEGNDPASCNNGTGGDCHVLIVDKDTCYLYELFALQHNADGSFSAGSGAIWDLNSNALRPDGWTSADAAGLPILTGLVRYNEVVAGVIDHALRFTVPHTKNAHIYPARHDAGSSLYLPPMGMRVRLKAAFDISVLSPQAQAVATALKKYGMLLADNGSAWYISGASDPNFDDSDLHTLNQIHGSDLEVVDTSSLVNGGGSQTVDLAVSLQFAPEAPEIWGGNVQMQAVVSNKSAAAAGANLLVTFGQPVRMGPLPSGCTQNAGGTISCSGTIAATGSQTYTFSLALPVMQTLQVNALLSPQSGSDSNPVDNIAFTALAVRPRPLARH